MSSPEPAKTSRLWYLAGFVLIMYLVWTASQQYHSIGNPLAASEQPFTTGHMEIQRADGSKAAFNIELALTPQQQELGLMYRKKLAPDAGMLFVWPHEQMVSMWMKNTEIPLDMLFGDHGGRITRIIANAVPQDLTILSSFAPVRVVLEIAGGEAARQNIKVGDQMLHAVLTHGAPCDSKGPCTPP